MAVSAAIVYNECGVTGKSNTSATVVHCRDPSHSGGRGGGAIGDDGIVPEHT